MLSNHIYFTKKSYTIGLLPNKHDLDKVLKNIYTLKSTNSYVSYFLQLHTAFSYIKIQ